MTPLLQKPLILLWCATVLGGALLWGESAIRAESFDKEVARSRYILEAKLPRIKLTGEQAAKNFVALLQYFNRAPFSGIHPDAAMLSSFSRKSDMDTLVGIYPELAKQWVEPVHSVNMQSEGEHTAAIVVEAKPQPSKSLVLVQEGGSWSVDMVATYAKWNGLEGAAKTEAIALLTNKFKGIREKERSSRCQASLSQIGFCIAQYAQDYDERYPLAKPWIDVLQPYAKSELLFDCPSVSKGQRYGYAYNTKLSNKAESWVADSAQTVSVYETSVLRRNANGIGENRAFRHLGGANYAYADGHVKWLAKSETPSFKLKP